jgi:hypothetical protein
MDLVVSPSHLLFGENPLVTTLLEIVVEVFSLVGLPICLKAGVNAVKAVTDDHSREVTRSTLLIVFGAMMVILKEKQAMGLCYVGSAKKGECKDVAWMWPSATSCR